MGHLGRATCNVHSIFSHTNIFQAVTMKKIWVKARVQIKRVRVVKSLLYYTYTVAEDVYSPPPDRMVNSTIMN